MASPRVALGPFSNKRLLLSSDTTRTLLTLILAVSCHNCRCRVQVSEKRKEYKTYLEDVSSGVIFERPSETGQDLNDVLGRQDGKKPVEKDLEPDRQCCATVQRQTGHVENCVGQRRLDRTGPVRSRRRTERSRPHSQFIQG